MLSLYDLGRRLPTPVESSPEVSNSLHSERSNRQHDQPERRSPPPDSHAFPLADSLMSTEVIMITDTATLVEAVETIGVHPFRHFPVVNTHQQIQAIISDRDLLEAQIERLPDNTSLMTIARRPVYCARTNTDIRQLSAALSEHHIGALPITDHNGKVQGIVTRTDILIWVSHYGHVSIEA